MGRDKEISRGGGGDKGEAPDPDWWPASETFTASCPLKEFTPIIPAWTEEFVRGRELAVVAGNTVQSLCDVSRSLQNNLLKSNRDIRVTAQSHSCETTSQVFTAGCTQGFP